MEDLVIPNHPKFPTRDENKLSEVGQIALRLGESKPLEQANGFIPPYANSRSTPLGKFAAKEQMINILLTIVGAKYTEGVIVPNVQIPASQHGFLI